MYLGAMSPLEHRTEESKFWLRKQSKKRSHIQVGNLGLLKTAKIHMKIKAELYQ